MSALPGRKQRLGKVAGSLVLIYLATAAFLWLFQRHLLYFPDRNAIGLPADHGLPQMKAVAVKTADGLALQGWFAPPRDKNGKVVVFFHGNGANVLIEADTAPYFLKHGYGFFFTEYRGYGGNPGEPSEQGIYNDARAVLGWLDRQGITESHWVFYGKSLGSGVAVQMATEYRPAAVILQSPYTSAVAVARLHYAIFPVDFLMKDRYDSLAKIGNLRAPLLVLHGTEDPLIPFSQGQALFAAAPEPKTFRAIEGARHNDLYEYGAGPVIVDWLDKEMKNAPANGAGAQK